MKLPPAVFLLGPTASGKTDMAQRLVGDSAIPFEIIHVDSALIYRGMDIGTAKPKERKGQHLIDVRDPSEPYSAADFRRDALGLMDEITQRGNIPLLVGGTMLYFKALKDGLADLPSADPELRSEILKMATERGWQAVHDRLQEVDAESAQRIKSTDTQRLQRALEVYELTGQPLSEHHQVEVEACPYSITQIGLFPQDRALLHQQIENRFMKMLEDGFVEEVREFYERGDLSLDLPSMRAVGYRQIWEYLDNGGSFDEMVNKSLAATRQLAKRQITWMRSWTDLVFVDAKPYANYARVLKIAATDIILH